MVSIIAHRGASKHAPQNTLSAFEKAIEMDADMIELDVHLSKDGEIVVMHDADVDSTTDGSGKLSEMSLEEIKRLDTGSPFGEEFAGETVPTLEEVLETTNGETELNIELKTRSGKNEGIEEKVLGLLEEHQMEDEVLISSFSFESVEKVKNLNSNISVGLLYLTLPLTSWHSRRIHKKYPWADAAHPWHRTIGKRHVRKLHEMGVEVNVWTVDGERNIRKMLESGVDGIITNSPGLARKLSKRKNDADEALRV